VEGHSTVPPSQGFSENPMVGHASQQLGLDSMPHNQDYMPDQATLFCPMEHSDHEK
jgi:hypothetical protein